MLTRGSIEELLCGRHRVAEVTLLLSVLELGAQLLEARLCLGLRALYALGLSL